MRRFKRHKTVAEIAAQCTAQGLTLDVADYEQGGDCIKISGGGAEVVYNEAIGWFIGTSDTGVKFDSNNALHESEGWFQALLEFFYSND